MPERFHLGVVLSGSGQSDLEGPSLCTGDLATRNQRCFKDTLGARYIYYDQGPVESYHDTEASYPLRWPLWYVAAKGMWDSRPTASELLMDACKKLFGPAADLLFSYYSGLADINSNCHAKGIAWHMPEPYELYTPKRSTGSTGSSPARRNCCRC